MFVFVYVTCSLFVIISAKENGEKCITPNDENATCVPIDSCPVIKKALTYLNEEAVKFAKDSQCGYADGPLVCCGSVGRITTPAPPVERTTPNQNLIREIAAAAPIDNPLLPDLTLCGLQLNRSKHQFGETARTEYPWLVSLKYINNADNSEEHKCNGALINQNYIVTSAYCATIDGYTLKSARLGIWKFSASDEDVRRSDFPEKMIRPIEIPIAESIVHPFYTAKRGSNNIGLLRLERKVEYNDIIRPICLPPTDFPSPVPHSEMEISSWSLQGSNSNVKLKGSITLLGFEECETAIQNYTKYYYPARICAKSTDDVYLCEKESGTPVATIYRYRQSTLEVLEDQWYLEGIASRDFGCDGRGKPGLYMRISRYSTWIINNMHA